MCGVVLCDDHPLLLRGLCDLLELEPDFPVVGASTSGREALDLLRSGAAEIGLQQASELLDNPDVEVIGMLPAELQQITIYSGGVTTNAKQPDAAKALIAALSTPAAQAIFKAKGLGL